MLKILNKINLENLKKVFKETFERFPLSLLISSLVFVLLIIRIYFEDFSFNVENILDKSIFTLAVSFFFSIGIYLFSESKAWLYGKKWFYQGLTLIFGLLFFYFFEENLFTNFHAEILVYMILTILGVIAFIFIAPFIQKIINKEESQKNFYIFAYNLIIKTLMSIIVGVVSMFLGFIALWALFTLFDLNFIDEGKTFSYWASFTLSFFAPLFFLANLSSLKINNEQKIEKNKFYLFLVNYVGLPAITIYFIILYSYTIKVLLNFSDWPQGKISWMVIGFSFFGYLIYFSSYIFVEKFKSAEIFRKYFPFVVLPQVAMLFYAIFLRIAQHDFTINRYLVVTFGIWLLGLSLYFIFSKKKYLGTIFYSLMIVILIISIGPWSVYTFPESRQQIKLVDKLKEAKILENKKLSPLKEYSDISEELSGKIYGSIEYLCNFHGCDTLNKICKIEIEEIKKQDREEFEKRKKDDLKIAKESNLKDEERIKNIEEREYGEIANWTMISKLTEKIKVRRYLGKINGEVLKYLSFNVKNYGGQDAIKITGYDYFLQIASSNFFEEEKTENFGVIVDSDSEQLIIYKGGEIFEKLSLKNVFEEILKKMSVAEILEYNKYSFILDKDELIFKLNGKNVDVQINFNNVQILNPEWDGVSKSSNNKEDLTREVFPLNTGYSNGYVLLKEK